MPGLRTGAPGKYFGKSNGQYRLVDEKVRYFVVPPLEDLNNSSVRLLTLDIFHVVDQL